MDGRSVQRSISKAWTVVYGLELGAAFANATSLRVSDEFRDLSLYEQSRYEDIYQKGIELAHYNFMLTDYSYFQFSWFGKENVRYAFYPNPFASAVAGLGSIERLRELEEAGWLTHEEYLAILSERHVANRDPMIRYEHAAGEYRAFHHPCAHLHVGHPPRGRWCVARALTPYAFTMLILKHQYPRQWQSCGASEADATGNRWETALLQERALLPEIGPDLLTALEKQTFRLD